MSVFSRYFDGLFGRGEHAITIPAMDGALRPNSLLDAAPAIIQATQCDNLTQWDNRVIYSSGAALNALDSAEPLADFKTEITCIAALPENGLLVGCADGTLHLHKNGPDGAGWHPVPGRVACPTAALGLEGGAAIVTSGSDHNAPQEWTRDLLQKRRSGKVYRLDLVTGERVALAQGLGWPAGVVQTNSGTILVSEAWGSRVLRIDMSGSHPREMLGNLPGYPGRLTQGCGAIWLSVFAPRSQLLEFVLHENRYRRAMMAEIDPALWIAPSLRSGAAILEPLQAGGVRQLGQLKPWAPARSFGLIIELDANLTPRRSFHSRSDGTRHGVTSILETPGGLLFSAKGSGMIGQLDLEDQP